MGYYRLIKGAMSSILKVQPGKLVEEVARYLKENGVVKPPEWAPFVKTGVHKERPPSNPDWWYIRCASILRKLYVKGPLGTSRLRTEYGGKRRRGTRPPKFMKGSGSIVRKALQQLEEAKLVEKVDRRGRGVTANGRALLEEIAQLIIRSERQRR